MAKEIVVSSMSQIYLGDDDTQLPNPPRSPEDVLFITKGFVDATISSGKILLSILPGVDLVGDQAQTENTALSSALQQRFTTLSAISLLVFVLLYVPCVATLTAIKHEFGTSWAVTSAIYQTVVAWTIAFMIYQGGLMLGFG